MTGTPNFCTQPAPSPEKIDAKPALMKLRGVGMTRGGHKQVLRNVNLTIRRGDFVAITGPNGGGKTTLIRIILGLLKPTQGSISHLQRGLRTGYLPQKSSIDSSYPITVREVVASGLLGITIDRAEARSRVDEMLSLVELTPHAAKPIGTLSGGQQQRALLARAIISRPELLVLDEPLSYVDKHFEQRIYDIIGTLAAHTTIILVSHEISTVAAMANRHLIVDTEITECPSARHFARVALCD